MRARRVKEIDTLERYVDEREMDSSFRIFSSFVVKEQKSDFKSDVSWFSYFYKYNTIIYFFEIWNDFLSLSETMIK